MSHREELIVLAAAARVAMGRDDRLTVEEAALKAVAQAIAMLEVIEVHADFCEDSDADEDSGSYFEKGYDAGVADNSDISQTKIDAFKSEVASLQKLESELREQLSASQEDARAAQTKVAELQKLLEQATAPVTPIEAAKQPTQAKK